MDWGKVSCTGATSIIAKSRCRQKYIELNPSPSEDTTPTLRPKSQAIACKYWTKITPKPWPWYSGKTAIFWMTRWFRKQLNTTRLVYQHERGHLLSFSWSQRVHHYLQSPRMNIMILCIQMGRNWGCFITLMYFGTVVCLHVLWSSPGREKITKPTIFPVVLFTIRRRSRLNAISTCWRLHRREFEGCCLAGRKKVSQWYRSVASLTNSVVSYRASCGLPTLSKVVIWITDLMRPIRDKKGGPNVRMIPYREAVLSTCIYAVSYATEAVRS